MNCLNQISFRRGTRKFGHNTFQYNTEHLKDLAAKLSRTDSCARRRVLRTCGVVLFQCDGHVVTMTCVMERLRRQLMEFEVLGAMYPEEESTDSRFVVDTPVTEVDALNAAVSKWEDHGGEIPTEAEVSRLPNLRASLTLRVPDDDNGGTVRLTISLPHTYPNSAPPSLQLSSSKLTRKSQSLILVALEKFATTLTSDLDEHGSECLMELARTLEERSAAAAAAEREEEEKKRKNATDDDRDATIAVLRIDHMNDSKTYVKTLQKWCTALGLGARVFWSTRKGAKSGKKWTSEDDEKTVAMENQSSKNETATKNTQPPVGRVENVFVILHGESESVSEFLKRTRVEFVDIDGKGNKCKERNTVVLCRRSIEVAKKGEDVVPVFSGFECEQFDGSNEKLELILKRFNLLHVGTGDARWKA